MISSSPRVQAAIDARANSTNDFFGGWEPADLDILSRWAIDPMTLEPEPGLIIDWLGGRTDLANHAWLPPAPDGIVVCDLPIPDDQIHAEAIEYVALLTAIERAIGLDSTFTMLELGASYAPWCSLTALVARRAGFTKVNVCPVEASRATLPRITRHAELNGLHDCDDVEWRIVHAAVSNESGTLYFPRVDAQSDNGAQVTDAPTGIDYRGLPQEYEAVRAVTLREVAEPWARVDYLHIDLQGAEEELLTDTDFLDVLDSKVRTLMLATQSRYIEGLALKTLSGRGWRLGRERPTIYEPNDQTADPNGWTLRDGAQVWLKD